MEECEAEDKSKPPRKYKRAPTKPKPVPPPKTRETHNKPLLEFPHFLRVIGPKHVKIIMQFMPSAVIYSITSLILITYMSEWKTVLQYFPYYNGKYYVENKAGKKDDEDE